MSNTNTPNTANLLAFLAESLQSYGVTEHLLEKLMDQPECVTNLEGSDLEALRSDFLTFIGA
jgi:hypothetical protein